MKAIKKYLANWDFIRILKFGLGLSLFIGYFSANENMYLFGGVFFSIQAIFNFGCAGGTCVTPYKKEKNNQIMEFEKYEPAKNKTDV